MITRPIKKHNNHRQGDYITSINEQLKQCEQAINEHKHTITTKINNF